MSRKLRRASSWTRQFALKLPLKVKSKSCYCLTFDIEVGTDVFWVFLLNFMVPKKNGKAAGDLYCKVYLSFHVKSMLHKCLLFNFFPVQVNTKNEPSMKGVSFKTVLDLSLRMGDDVFFWLLWVWPPATFIEKTYEKKKQKNL